MNSSTRIGISHGLPNQPANQSKNLPLAPSEVPQVGQQPGFLERPDRSLLLDVDHQGVAGLSARHERHDALIARRGVLHHALVTVDDPHARDHRTGV